MSAEIHISDVMLTARVLGQKPELVTDMEEKGVKAILARNSTIITLPKLNGNGTFIKPEVMSTETTLLINCAECGGENGKEGKATVVCGLSGKKLVAYRFGSKSCGDHAYFAVPGGIITVTGDTQDYTISIDRHIIEDKDGETKAKIKSETLWQGEPYYLENEGLGRYYSAAKAALCKALCNNCIHVHYAENRGQFRYSF